jgi:type IV pilus assembly protein PilY1
MNTNSKSRRLHRLKTQRNDLPLQFAVFTALRPLATALLLAFGTVQWTFAGTLPLAQVPAGNGGREPAPNLIVTVDDSGSMGSAGISSLKAALQNSFSTTAIADDTIRLGFQAMWRCRGLSATPYKGAGSTACPDTRIQSFSGTHRTNFNSWVSSLAPASGTPSHQMMKLVHNYMSTATGVWSPYAHKPGVTETPLLSCRKTFHIFMTDGGWKDTGDNNTPPRNTLGTPGNADSVDRVLPDGKVYAPYSTTVTENGYALETQTRVYRDTYTAGHEYPPVDNASVSSTDPAVRGTVVSLADWAFHMWSTDYASTISNDLIPIIKQAGTIDIGATGTPVYLTEYWNPRNNPMTWQGVTMYTIGFNGAANLSTARKKIRNYGDTNNPYIQAPKWDGSTWGADITTMMRGETVSAITDVPINKLQWGNPLTSQSTTATSLSNDSGDAKDYELWHMALNGRGRYVPATNATELSNAFAEIVNQVIADSSAPLSSIAASTQTAFSDTKIFTAGYDSAKWSGTVQARALDSNYNVGSSATWSAAAVLDAISTANLANRFILTHDGTSGALFNWASFTTSQKLAIKGADTDTVGQNRVSYLRGDQTMEQSAGGDFRNRSSRLGDVVNSNLWVLGKPNLGYSFDGYKAFRAAKNSRTQMVYVGANDGMLHGFSAVDGSEKIAYVPRGVYGSLKPYTDPAYPHLYSVDGSPFTSDVYNGTTWKTMLVGTLAGGGKGYFVLDVTDPSAFTAANASNLVVMDQTGTIDADIGHIYAEPTADTSNSAKIVQITKLNNGRWAVLMGNGVNSTNEKAVFLVQYLDGDKSLKKIVLEGTGGNGNGLANPQIIDIDGDGKSDLAYAGDLQGNLWKIDLTSTDDNNWGSYFVNGTTPQPLFVARDSSNVRQPITTAPQWATHPIKGLSLAMGTGREMTVSDRTTTSTQTLYSIWDDSTISPSAAQKITGGTAISDITNGRASLVAQTQTQTVVQSGKEFYKTSSNPVVYTGSVPKRGWYLDLPNSGERAVNNGGMLNNRLLLMRSRIPGNGSVATSGAESCTPTASSAVEYLTAIDIVAGTPPPKPAFDDNGGGFTGTETTGLSRWKAGREDRLLLKTSKPGESVSISAQQNQSMRLNSGLAVNEMGWRQLQ